MRDFDDQAFASGDGDAADSKAQGVAMDLAVPVPPVPPTITCGDVYATMARDERLVALPIVEDGVPLGLTDRVSLMSQLARPYWWELYGRKPITKLMDPAPLMVDAALPVEAVGLRIAREKRSAINSGFIVLRDGKYFGVATSLVLLKQVADRAGSRAQELSVAHQEIRTLNDELEHRIEDRTAELHAAQQELLRKERLSALGQLTATVAHEMRNPLSAIRNTLFGMRDTLAPTGLDLGRPIERMERSVARCDRIIGELLDFTSLRELQRSTVLADQWLEEVLGEQSLPPGIALACRFGGPGCRVRFDIERMRRVVINLFENAVQAIVQADAGSGGQTITVATRLSPATYEIAIEDTGPGIPKDVLPRVFEPLFTTKSFGTGLGLATVKQIVEQHGGDIAVKSEPGKGTRMTVGLPILSAKDVAA